MPGSAVVWLAAATESPVHVARKVGARGALKGDGPIRWLFLGRNYDRIMDWEMALGSGFERITYGRQMQELALEWRTAYLEWIGRMGQRHASLEWWTSAIAERNTMTASLYHSLCYLRIGIGASEESLAPILIVAESHAVLCALGEHPDLRTRARRIRSWRTPPFMPVWFLRFGYRWARYGVDAVTAQLDAWSTRRGRSRASFTADRPRVLLHSCIDETYFGSDGVARDRYFPELAALLARRGLDVVTLPWLCNLRRSRRSAFTWFRRDPQRYLIPEDYYRLRDYAWAAAVVCRQIRLPSGADEFQGLRVVRLVREARLLQAADPAAAKFIRYYRLVEHCARQAVRIDVFIDMFENLACEKASVMAFRRWMPQVVTVGYQHYLSMYPLLLSLFTSPDEAQIAPHPDVLVSSSSLGAEQLIAAGFPAKKIRSGPSLRYQSLLATHEISRTNTAAALVVVPQESFAARELLTKLLTAFRDGEFAISLKLHPMMPLDVFSACLAGRALPDHFTIVAGDMDGLLSRVGCAIVLAGSTALEIALKSVPVVVVGRDTDFDFSALAWFSEFPEPAYAPEEIYSQVREKLADLSRTGNLEAWANRTLKKAVTPISEETVLAFVRPRARDVEAVEANARG